LSIRRADLRQQARIVVKGGNVYSNDKVGGRDG
jgi:hypothetical protein